MTKTHFDTSIKQSFLDGRPAFNQTFYTNEEYYNGIDQNGNHNPLYLNPDIINIIGQDILEDITRGRGNEIITHKFFSVGSSCRFAVASFSALNNNDNKLHKINSIGNTQIQNGTLEFEKNCSIRYIQGGSPQLDVYFQTTDNSHYFFEVKCHELFDYLQLRLSPQYQQYFHQFINEGLMNVGQGLFQHWNNLTHDDFGVHIEQMNRERFDFKQFICHLLGIISFRENHPVEPIKFYCLFYRINDAAFDAVYQQLEQEIKAVAAAFSSVFQHYRIEFGFIYNNDFDTLNSLTPTWLFTNEPRQ